MSIPPQKRRLGKTFVPACLHAIVPKRKFITSSRIARMSFTESAKETRASRIGRHLPTSGGLRKTLALAEELDCEAAQIFVSNPQGWAEPAPRPDAEAFAAGCRDLGLYPVVVHSKYLINLASPDASHRARSVKVLASELSAAGALGAHVVVVHSGSRGGSGEVEGLKRLAEGIAGARELAGAGAAELVLENSVGAGTQLCSRLEDLAQTAEAAGARVCLDTAHAFVAGYDLSTAEGAAEVGAELLRTLGDRIALLHLNDARNPLGSRKDGHRKIGEGHIPEAAWSALFAALPGVPAVMETPYGGNEADAHEVQFVKKLASRLPFLGDGR